MSVVLVSRNPVLAMALEGTAFDVVEVAPTRLDRWIDEGAGDQDALVLDLGSSRAAVAAVQRLRAEGVGLPVLVVVSNPDKEPELLALARTGVIGPPVTAARVGAALATLVATANEAAVPEQAVPEQPVADAPRVTPAHPAQPAAPLPPVARTSRDDLRAALLEPVPALAADEPPGWLSTPTVAVTAAAADVPAGVPADVAADGPTDAAVEPDGDDRDTAAPVVVDLRQVPRSRHPAGPLTPVTPQDDLREELLTARAGTVASVTHMESKRRGERTSHRAPSPGDAAAGAAVTAPALPSVVSALSSLADTSGVTALTAQLFGVTETAQAIVADALERSCSDAAALLVPDDHAWRVSAGEGLRPLETRYQLAPDDWLVERVAQASKGVIVEGTDAARHALRGAPLASRKHLVAVPIQLPGSTPGAILLVARDADPAFGEDDLAEMARLAREASPLLVEALRVRDVARALAPYQDLG